MQVWPVLTILCSAAAVALAYPLIRRFESASQRAEREAAIYESQLAEVQTDAAAGNISDSDAELAKSEIQRRLAAVQKTVETQRPVPSPWRGVAIASTAGLLILGSVNLYLVLGRPDLNSVPSPAVASASSTASVSQAEMVNTTPADNAAAAAGGAGQVTDMVSKLAERLKSQPNDAEGWRMLGWSYFNLQNYAQSAEAYKRALALDPGNIDYKSSYAEALVQAADGSVTPEAQKLIGEVLAADPKEFRARFYRALASEQAGDQAAALDQWLALLQDAPSDAGWREDVKARIADLGKATGRDVSAALALPSLPPAQQTAPLGQAEKDAMVDGMIAKLAQKLAANPKDRDGWAMMIRSLTVRGDKAGADKALADALAIFKDDPETVAGLKAVAAGQTGGQAPAQSQGGALPPMMSGAAAPDLNTVDQDTRAAIQQMAPNDQQQVIRGMVAKLAARLESSPGDSEGWVRLMRSYMVLNDPAAAKGAKEKALQAFAGDPVRKTEIESAAKQLGID